jgi:hypothetical protein
LFIKQRLGSHPRVGSAYCDPCLSKARAAVPARAPWTTRAKYGGPKSARGCRASALERAD